MMLSVRHEASAQCMRKEPRAVAVNCSSTLGESVLATYNNGIMSNLGAHDCRRKKDTPIPSSALNGAHSSVLMC